MTGNDDERAKRLAAALRENLKRRKAQARGVPDTVTESSRRKPGPMNIVFETGAKAAWPALDHFGSWAPAFAGVTLLLAGRSRLPD